MKFYANEEKLVSLENVLSIDSYKDILQKKWVIRIDYTDTNKNVITCWSEEELKNTFKKIQEILKK